MPCIIFVLRSSRRRVQKFLKVKQFLQYHQAIWTDCPRAIFGFCVVPTVLVFHNEESLAFFYKYVTWLPFWKISHACYMSFEHHQSKLRCNSFACGHSELLPKSWYDCLIWLSSVVTVLPPLPPDFVFLLPPCPPDVLPVLSRLALPKTDGQMVWRTKCRTSKTVTMENPMHSPKIPPQLATNQIIGILKK